MIHLSIKMLPSSQSGLYRYNMANLFVQVDLGREYKLKDNYSFMVYSDSLILMAGATTWDSSSCKDRATHEERTFSMTMHGSSVWMPGKYFFLMSVNASSVTRFDLELDEKCCFTVGEAHHCEPTSAEMMLALWVFDQPHRWHPLCCMKGMAPLRNKAIEWLRRNAISLNANNDAPNKSTTLGYDLLVTCGFQESEQVVQQGLKVIFEMCCPKVQIRMGDCSKLFEPKKKKKYDLLDTLFDEWTDPRQDIDYASLQAPKYIYVFYNLRGMKDSEDRSQLLRRLHEVWPDQRHSAVFCGTQAEVDALLEQDSLLRQHFSEMNCLAREPITLDEVTHGFFKDSFLKTYVFSPAAVEKVCNFFVAESQHGQLKDSEHYATNLEFQLMLRQFNVGANPDDNVVEAVDIKEALGDPKPMKPECNMSEDLDAMIGLDDIKRSIVTLSNRRLFYEHRRQLGLNTSDEGTYHAIFTGNPGTGKTTVAKMMGHIYHSLGLLSKGDVICVDRAKMVGEYIGQTEQIMKQILSDAQGNVLFVDEAYTLYRKNNDKDFGQIVVESLLEVLSSDHPDMIIIFAGYKQEMDELMTINPGLEGRFPYKFHFEDYSADQLMQIATGQLEKDQYLLTDEAASQLQQVIRNAVIHRTRTFANARWMLQFIRNGIIPAMANRLVGGGYAIDKETYQTIVAEDVFKADSLMNDAEPVGSPRNTVGFRA